jgi:hypothetical protein
MRNLITTPTAITAALAFTAIGSMVVPPSFAQTVEPYQEVVQANCADSSCNFLFDLVPAGKQLEITNVSCRIQASPASARIVIALLRVVTKDVGVKEDLEQILVPVFLGESNFQSFTASNDQTLLFVPERRRVQALISTVNTATSVGVKCKIAGSLHTLL